MAIARVAIPGIKPEFIAHSQINNQSSKGADVADFTYLKPEDERFFTTYVDAGKPGNEYPRYHDTEAKILENIASQIESSATRGKIVLYTEQEPCDSCKNIISEFRERFPHIELEFITAKIHN